MLNKKENNLQNNSKNDLTERQPVVVVMGHVDHGKSSLLDAIRNSNVVEDEIGGITQQISAYEVHHKTKDGQQEKPITFLDTPGHQAFQEMRESGVKIADIAILIVSAEDGVMPQTLEAYKAIAEKNLPLIVAISKVDKPGANIQKTKNSLIENGIYLEGMGGEIPVIEIDSKSKKGLDELLEMILLLADLKELKYDNQKNAEGFILESLMDGRRGISSTLIIKDGILPKSGLILAGTSLAPIRIIENFAGQNIQNPHAGQAIKVVGFDSVPEVTSQFISDSNKKELEKICEDRKNNSQKKVLDVKTFRNAKIVIPVILKADTLGTFNAVEREIKKVETDKKTDQETGIKVKIIGGGIGNITEGDILSASHDGNVMIVGFNVKVENTASEQAERFNLKPVTFEIIYKLTEWFQEMVDNRLPFKETEKSLGKLKVLKIFSAEKDKQVIGGKVFNGLLKINSKVKISRRNFEIGVGKITELQMMKIKTQEVLEGNECGLQVESKTEIITGDILEAFEIQKEKII